VNFQCPESMRVHAKKVLAGEYDVPGIAAPRTVLDIGANVGAFAVWVHRKWPEAHVTCYEPDADNCALLCANTANTGFGCVEAAVYCGGKLNLFRGIENCGEHSLVRGCDQSPEYVTVVGVDPADLPRCDFLKVDTEGAELVIVTSYPHLAGVQAIALEWHSEDHRWMLRKFLMAKGFAIVSDEAWHPIRGVMKARRT